MKEPLGIAVKLVMVLLEHLQSLLDIDEAQTQEYAQI
jgi:hypothetical protein